MNPLFDTLFAPLAHRPAPLLLCPGKAPVTGSAFAVMVAQAAHALRAAGVGVGDRVAVHIEKSPEGLAVYGAAVALGAVFLPLNPAYTPLEVDYFTGNATPAVLITDPARARALGPICHRHGTRLMTMDAAGSGSFADSARLQPDQITATPRGPDDLAAILYTSGTTGRSKGAMLTQGNLLSNAIALADLWQFTDRDTLLHALPVFHTHGLFVATNIALLTGAAMIFLPGFDVETVIAQLPRATAMMGVPTFYTRLLDHAGLGPATAGIRLFVSGSAPLLAETHTAFHASTGHHILERYGMTETNMNTSNPFTGVRKPGTVGLPLPGVEVRLRQSGADVATGAVGAIEVRGPNVFAGYWQMPEKTAAELGPDGWFQTGDLGQFDTDGYLSIVGRAKDLIISGGFNIYPREVELALDCAPGVLESAVIGLPHPDFGEAVFAVLTARPGVVLDTDAVLATLHGTLARYKQPKAAVVLAALPRNAMGKVQKAALRADHSDWFAKG